VPRRQAAAYWAGREQAFQDILHRADQAALEYLQAWAGVTRTGYRAAGLTRGTAKVARTPARLLFPHREF
jgi:hypothetical protein